MVTSNLERSLTAERREFLAMCLPFGMAGCTLPELGKLYRGKVRDCYTVGDRRILIATDRISAFDRVFAETIPFKGEVLNRLSAHFLVKAAEIVPTHLVSVPDPNVTIARELEGYPVEVVVRGYLTGSAWRDYQEGVFGAKYGFELPAGLPANARLDTPVVTPTTKSAAGHDQPITPAQAAQIVGGESFWKAICDSALKLFAQGTRLAAERGLILVDTKYEFGREREAGGQSEGRRGPAGDKRSAALAAPPDWAEYAYDVVLMDEVHTPDSSRYWYTASYERDPLHPEQLSKEFLRDWLREQGFTGDGPVPTLTDDVRVEIAGRYLHLFETLTGQPFKPLASETPDSRIWRNLKAEGLMQGYFVGVLMGSASDAPLADKLAERLEDLGIASRQWVLSAHKVPDKVFKAVSELNETCQPTVLVTIAGRSNGLSGVTAANSVLPVIALPAFADKADYLVNIHSSTQMPSDTPALVVLDPGNAALAAARMLAIADPELRETVRRQVERVRAGFEG